MQLLARRSDIYDHVCFIDKEDYAFDHIRNYHHLMQEVENSIPGDENPVLLPGKCGIHCYQLPQVHSCLQLQTLPEVMEALRA